MDTAIIFDCEFLTRPGAPSRFWCGPHDPDPVIAQIGAVRLALADDFAITDTFRIHVHPPGRFGAPQSIDPLFTKLTGITPDILATEGQPLASALAEFAAFAGADRLWSWGKDELNLMAISCYIAGIAPVIPAHRFWNACHLLRAAGMPYDDLTRTRSNTLMSYYGLSDPDLVAHDALDDARSVAIVVQHLLRRGQLSPAEFRQMRPKADNP